MFLECESRDSFSEELLELYYSSFSEIEKIPLENLERAMAHGAVLDVYSEDGRFIGFTYSFIDADKLFLIYFATVPEVRGKGYGARILDMHKERYRDKRSFLITEPKDRHADDYEMRVRRQAFYVRNGCVETGVKILSDDAWFDSMFLQGTLTDQEMVDIVRLYEDIHNGRTGR